MKSGNFELVDVFIALWVCMEIETLKVLSQETIFLLLNVVTYFLFVILGNILFVGKSVNLSHFVDCSETHTRYIYPQCS